MSSAFDFYFYLFLGSVLSPVGIREHLFSQGLTQLPEWNLTGYDWVIYPDPITVFRKKIILIGLNVHTWTESVGVTQGKVVTTDERNGYWTETKSLKTDFYSAEKYRTEMASEHSLIVGDGRRLIIFSPDHSTESLTVSVCIEINLSTLAELLEQSTFTFSKASPFI